MGDRLAIDQPMVGAGENHRRAIFDPDRLRVVVALLSAGMEEVERILAEHPITPVIGLPDLGQLPDDFAVFRYPNVRVAGDRVFILYGREWFEFADGAKSGFEDEGMGEVVLGREDVLRSYPLQYFYG